VTKKERTKNPYLFKIEQIELSSIIDYLKENDNDIVKNKKDLPPQNIMSKFMNIFNSNEPKEIESNLSIKNDNTPQSDKILNENMNSNRELIKQLNEEKNKNKQLLNELNNEKKKVLELTNKIKLLEETYSNNDNFKKINELQKLINAKDKELNNLKLKLQNNDLLTSINDGEEIIAVNFTSSDQDINCPMACKNTNILARLEEKLYNDYPKYKDYHTYLTVNGIVVKRFKTLEENGIKNGNSIIVNKYDE